MRTGRRSNLGIAWGAIAPVIGLAVGLAVGLAGCGGAGDDDALTVLAASSLTDAFEELDASYAAAGGGEARFGFAGSTELAAQLEQGVPADVVALADAAAAVELAEAGLISTPAVFATNSMTIVVEAGNPLGITGLDALADRRLVVVRCAAQVPCGRYTDVLLDRAGVELHPSSLEENVRGVLAKVRDGEADAGIVYQTDVLAAGPTVASVAIDDALAVRAEYAIAAVAGAEERATEFVAFVLSPAGQAILARHGFGPP